jgi:hypothetical protein
MKYLNTIGKIGLLGIAGLMLSQTSTGQVTKSGQGYLLRMKFTKGQTLNYRLNMNMTTPMSTNAMNIVGPIKMTVASVDKGVATLNTTAGPFTSGGKALGKQETATIKQDTMGRIVGGDANQIQSFVSLPQKPVKVGESWTATNKINAGPAGAMTVNAKYTLKSVGNVNGKQVANIAVSLSGAGQMKVNGSGSVQMLVSDGSLMDSTTTLNMTMNNPQNGQSMTMKATSKLTRQ